MKAKVRTLAPQLEKAVREQVEKQMSIERAWIAHAVVALCCWVMMNEYDWGPKRIHRIYHQLLDTWNILIDEYGADCWYVKILGDLKRRNIEIAQKSMDIEREEHIELAKRAVKLSPGQQAKILAIEKEMNSR